MDTPKLTRSEITTLFKTMRIMHPRIERLIEVCEGARRAAKLAPYESHGFIEMFAESSSGKSHAIKVYIERIVVPQVIKEGLFNENMPVSEIAARQKKVIHVTLNEKATRESVYESILNRLTGAPVPKNLKLTTLRRQLFNLFRGEGDEINNPDHVRPCELLIIDEIQHLSAGVITQIKGRKAKELSIQGTDVTDALKFMMIEGLVPLLLIGIPESRVHLSIDKQIVNRREETIDFDPIHWNRQSERKLFEDYCGKTGLLIKDKEMLPEPSDFLSEGIPHLLHEASGGLIGRASRIAAEAVYHAIQRKGRKVEFKDLAEAVDTRAIPDRYCSYNPFREGIRKTKGDRI